MILDALIGASQRLTRAAWGAASSSPLPYTGLLTQDKNGIAALELMDSLQEGAFSGDSGQNDCSAKASLARVDAERSLSRETDPP